MAQSLEELSSIYSEANELGLTALGVAQPHQMQPVQDMMEHTTAVPVMTETQLEVRGEYDSDQVS